MACLASSILLMHCNVLDTSSYLSNDSPRKRNNKEIKHLIRACVCLCVSHKLFFLRKHGLSNPVRLEGVNSKIGGKVNLQSTLPETKKSPLKIGCLSQKEISSSNHPFSGARNVSLREGKSSIDNLTRKVGSKEVSTHP